MKKITNEDIYGANRDHGWHSSIEIPREFIDDQRDDILERSVYRLLRDLYDAELLSIEPESVLIGFRDSGRSGEFLSANIYFKKKLDK